MDDRVVRRAECKVRRLISQAYYYIVQSPCPHPAFGKICAPVCLQVDCTRRCDESCGTRVLILSTISLDVSFAIAPSRCICLLSDQRTDDIRKSWGRDGERRSAICRLCSVNVQCMSSSFLRPLKSHASDFLSSCLSSSTAIFHRPDLRSPFHLNSDFTNRS